MRPFHEIDERPFAIGAAATEIIADPAPWAALFAGQRAIVCRDIFAPELFARLLAGGRATTYRDDDVAGLGTRAVEEPQRLSTAINLLLRRPALYDWLGAVTGHRGLSSTDGRLVLTRAGAGDALDWHNDLNRAGRTLGLTISFTDMDYEGGRFEMRDKDAPATTRWFDHVRPGTALIFDLDRNIEHRVHPVTTGGPRRIFAGWFLRGEEAQ